MKSFEGLNLLIFIGGWEKYDQYLGTFYKVVRTSLSEQTRVILLIFGLLMHVKDYI